MFGGYQRIRPEKNEFRLHVVYLPPTLGVTGSIRVKLTIMSSLRWLFQVGLVNFFPDCASWPKSREALGLEIVNGPPQKLAISLHIAIA